MANSRYPRVNPKSGLQEEWDDYFKVPSVAQRSITSLRFNGQSTAVHTVPLENGLSLDFYARLGASDELGRSGVKRVLLIGGSGNGHRAMRRSAHVPGSLANVQAPATGIHRYFPNAKKNYLSTVWPGWNAEKLPDALPERFNMPALYQHRASDNFVNYTQNTHDPHYLETLRAALGAPPTGTERPCDKRWLALHEGEEEGHGAMPPPEFREHRHRALTWWREHRPAHH